MIDPKDFFQALKAEEVGPFVGVPCSLISSLIAYAVEHPQEVSYVNPAHESHAMGYAAGSYMATGTLPMVFMQNSGFGNIVNPLTSLHQIYDIPALLLVTWRAESGYGTDAPEHWIVGRDMENYFKTFHLPYRILTKATWRDDLKAMAAEARTTKKPAVICAKKGMFADYKVNQQPGAAYEMTSMDAVRTIKEALADAVFLSTTGMISRESFTAKDTPDFYMMGSMGLISAVAAGCAEHTQKKVVALDGDGAALMHLGILPLIGSRGYRNLVHVVIDNEAYSSTQGQPTVSPAVDFPVVAKACGYREAFSAKTKEELEGILAKINTLTGPALLHVKVQSGNDHHIGRVSDKYTCPQVTENFMKHVQS